MPSSSPLYDAPLTLIDGTETTFADFRGKTVLVVNVASKCGFTPQYAGLEALYDRFKDDGLVVLGLPCNQFMGQEPGEAADIEAFCQLNYGVTFPMTDKVDVRGKHQHPLYAQLTKFKSGLLPGLVKWNFEKFLVNSEGEIVDRFASTVEPESPELVGAIEKTLASAAA
ncbi:MULTISPECIES: glutathione peroxidase [unclassified Cryobacterium]|jgi:glutathione peroxidase|uniref:glutathione peroxidase n=1 Tax=unclassified Cryobacterium TaxID=2649013 RepID=UPI002AB4C0EE|nr:MULTISPECIES: glutathione peroxidase [unclassified Cryobacterium]MDY7543273.1 glutathione peroxidase [Cryobacterium sp. 5B3]MEA9999363.1 glutathione peroxidase [Cryobacterium sp. RTS3]MEB0265144.1 glutathione peroxidase [Cryobacterium sp. 10I5]MEB0274949.1 glutathione peroxidase [Cryobacterium sp. 5B3]